MDTVSAYEAKTHLPKLLRRVSLGEKIMITRHGVPVAVLCPPDPIRKRETRSVIEDLKIFRKKHALKGLSLRDMINEGRL
jgi:prevent-host-death family protein